MENVAVQSPTREQRLELWITQYADAILRLCFVYLRDAGQAEDAMQDTFLKAWKSMEQFEQRNGCTEKAWLMRIAVNVCHDYHRSRWFRHVDRTRTPDDLHVWHEAVLPEDHGLLMDVYNLPEKYKRVILLYYYQEMTLRETAEALGVSRSAVHKQLKKAQELLKGRLTGRDIDGE